MKRCRDFGDMSTWDKNLVRLIPTLSQSYVKTSLVSSLLEAVRTPNILEIVTQLKTIRKMKTVLPWVQSVIENEEDIDKSTYFNVRAMIYIHEDSETYEFLQTDRGYDPVVVGEYCEAQKLFDVALFVYRTKNLLKKLIQCATGLGWYDKLIHIVIQKQDSALWEEMMSQEPSIRNNFVTNLVSPLINFRKYSVDEMSVVVKCFTGLAEPPELMELLEKVIANCPEMNIKNLQSVLLLTAMRVLFLFYSVLILLSFFL
jgi:hypothetical protein